MHDVARGFSRNMPPIEKPRPAWNWLVVVFFLLAPWLTLDWRIGLGSTIGVAVIGRLIAVFDRQRVERIARDRAGESICTYARSFGRSHDFWVLRAVWDGLQPAAGFPIRPSDYIEEDLAIDVESLDCRRVLKRTGRSTANTRRNPYCNRVKTVAGLVAFIEAQPRIA